METIHLIQMLRKEANSGQMRDLAHVRSAYCLADALTKAAAKPDQLIQSINAGKLEKVDEHPPFRMLLQHEAFMVAWLKKIVSELHKMTHGFGLFGEYFESGGDTSFWTQWFE